LTPDVAVDTWRLYPHTFARRLSRGRWRAQAYHRLISLTIAAAVLAGVGCIIVVEAPPRHGKSELVSHWLPAWYLSLWPDKNVLLGAYEADFAAEWGRKVRNTLEEHASVTGVPVAGDSSAADHWETVFGGGMRTAGVKGGATGKPGNLIVIDDPVKNDEEADSDVIREKHWNWFQTVVWTRREPGTIIVIMHTRWRTDDLAGRVLAHTEMAGITKHLHFPAIAEAGDQLGRKPGEALWPSKFPLDGPDGLLMTKSVMEARHWNALFQQKPTNEDGNEFIAEWWKYFDELPVPLEQMDYVACYWDTSFNDEESSDFVAGGAWAVYGGARYLLEVVHDRMHFIDALAAAKAMHKRWNAKATFFEKSANGHACITSMRIAMNDSDGKVVQGIVPKESKFSRARSVMTIVAGGNVHLRRHAAWVPAFLKELSAFPRGDHDDQVDMVSMALHNLRPWQRVHASVLTSSDDRQHIPRTGELKKRLQELIPLQRYG
jgi:predicted phage terminase large subunit-like protein